MNTKDINYYKTKLLELYHQYPDHKEAEFEFLKRYGAIVDRVISIVRNEGTDPASIYNRLTLNNLHCRIAENYTL